MSRRRSDKWSWWATWGGVVLNLALFVLNLAAATIFLSVAAEQAENNRRIRAILDERRPKAWTEAL